VHQDTFITLVSALTRRAICTGERLVGSPTDQPRSPGCLQSRMSHSSIPLGSKRRFCDCVDGVHFPSPVDRRGRVERRGRQAHAATHLTHLHRLRLLLHGVDFVVVLSRHLLGERCEVPLLRSHDSGHRVACVEVLSKQFLGGRRVVIHFGHPALGECQVRQIGQQQRHVGRFSSGYDRRKILPDDCVEESA
jgi:hypothetical protein